MRSYKIPIRILRLSHVLTEFSMVMQLIIFIIYWVAIHHKLEHYIKLNGLFFEFYMIVIHVQPFCSITFDFIFSKYKMHLSDIKYFMLFSILFGVNNCVQTLLFPRRPYPFLMWNSWFDIITIGILVAIFLFFYYIMYLVAKRF